MNKYRIIGYLKVPDFYLQLHSLFYREGPDEAVVIGGSVREYGVVLESSPAACRRGVRSGMLCSAAKAIDPSIRIVPPDTKNYDHFVKKIIDIISDFSLKCIKDRYDSFYLFLPDYFFLEPTIRQIQERVRMKLHLRTQTGISVNKCMARLAAAMARLDQIFQVDAKNVHEAFQGQTVDRIEELNLEQRNKLKLAGIRFLHQLLPLSLNELRFLLEEKAETVYHNYIALLKTTKEEDRFIYDEIIFHNARNNRRSMKEAVSDRMEQLLRAFPRIEKLKILVGYIDNKDYIFSKKIGGPVTSRMLTGCLMKLVDRMKRRVRIRRIKIGVIPGEEQGSLLVMRNVGKGKTAPAP
ncbi:MAG: hypothetical protein PHF84_10350 [bacterium]|nr:hypothetical protein [bacterium]